MDKRLTCGTGCGEDDDGILRKRTHVDDKQIWRGGGRKNDCGRKGFKWYSKGNTCTCTYLTLGSLIYLGT